MAAFSPGAADLAPAFFDRVAGDCDDAAGHAPVYLHRYRIAGLTLHIRFIGDALIRVIHPALAHLGASPGPVPDLTLTCLDSASTGTPFPHAPIPKAGFTPRGEIVPLTTDRYRAAFEPSGRLLSLFDVAGRRAIYCTGDAAAIPRFDVAEPIRAILGWFMRAHRRQLVHAGAIGRPDGGVLLLGRSGAGKSNTALRALASPLQYAADDFCAVSAAGPPTAYSLYSTGKTREEDWRDHPLLEQLSPDLDPTRADKAIYFLAATVPDRLIAAFPIRALLLVRRGGDEIAIRPLQPGAVLAATAPDTAMLLPGSGAEVLSAIGRLVRAVPCYTLQLGRDPEAICPAIETLLDSFRAPALSGTAVQPDRD